MRRRPEILVALVVTPVTLGVVAWLLAEPPRERVSAPPPPPVAVTPTEATPPPAAGFESTEEAVPRELAERLARARLLAGDVDPLAVALLERAATEADAAPCPRLAAAIRGELERLHAELRTLALETAKWTSAEARALAKAGSPASVGRFVEAIAAAKAAGDGEGVRALERDLAAARGDLHAHEVERIVERQRADPLEEAAATDKDEEVRSGFAALARGEAGPSGSLITRLVARADSSHEVADCKGALRDLSLARHAFKLTTRLLHDESWSAEAASRTNQREVRCRLEEAGRAICRADGPAACALVDLGELTRLDGTAPRTPRVLYLVGRALEADGQPDEARKHYWAAIGTATWLAADTSMEVVRYLARCRAAGASVSARSPGAGPTWRSLPRARFTLFHELTGSALALAQRVEGARTRALEKLGFADPVRLAQKTSIVVFPSEERYRSSGSSPRGWAAGHASHETLEDGRGSTIVVYEPAPREGWVLEDVLVHEWAHVLVGDHLGGATMPSWAVEGVASWTESEDWRASRLATFATTRRWLPPWGAFLMTARDRRYVGSSSTGASIFYAQSLVAFETAARRKGSAAAVLAAATKLLGAKEPFDLLGFKDTDDFDASVTAVVPARPEPK